jgi:hypothetical protein
VSAPHITLAPVPAGRAPRLPAVAWAPVRTFNTSRGQRRHMYAVVGCSECEALWVVEGRPETTGCPRCGKRHQFDSRKQFVRTDDEAEARAARAALLAAREGSDIDATEFAAMAADADAAGIDDEAYLEAMGVDPAEVAAAGDDGGRSRSREETVRDAVAAQERPDEDAVVAYATEHGVPAEAARDLLDRLVRAGEATESGGTYRLL